MTMIHSPTTRGTIVPLIKPRRVAPGWLALLASCWMLSPAAADTQCPGEPPAPPEAGLCRVIAGAGDATLLTGTVLLGVGVTENGQVLVGSDGGVLCSGCDCSDQPAALDATRIECPEGVISPGLIDSINRFSFSQNPPYVATDPTERYAHRHQWRLGLDGATPIPSSGNANTNQVLWAEMRSVMVGVTSAVSSGQANGFLRNLNRNIDAAELGQDAVNTESFPLGDTAGQTLTEGCTYPNMQPLAEGEQRSQILAEGIDARARNEFLCMSGQGVGSIEAIERSAVQGGLGLLTEDLQQLRDVQGSLVWQPRSQISLYGSSTPVLEALSLGLPVALGSNWTITGSMHLGRELACARELDQTYFGSRIGDRRLWQMVTGNGARSAGMSGVLGTLAAGAAADLIVVDRRSLDPHTAVITAEATDFALVMRGGLPLYGDADLLANLDSGEGECDIIDVCGADRRICVPRETGNVQTFSSLEAAVAGTVQPLVVCGLPDNEPSCVPFRTAPFAYTGIATLDDQDGDGVLDDVDNCPTVFNPPRPIDGGAQADSNGNGIGDACDACPLALDPAECADEVFADGFEPAAP